MNKVNGYGVKAGQVYRDRDTRMGGRTVKVVSVFFNVRKLGRLHARTWYAKAVTGKRQIVTITCESLASYKWEISRKRPELPVFQREAREFEAAA